MTSKIRDNLHFDLMILLMLCEYVCIWLCMCLCCPRRTAVEIAATVRRSPHGCEGVAWLWLLPYTTEDLICLQFLHICIFKIALYKHWNVYFHYIAMQCILFKVIEMKRTEKRVPVIVLYHVWSMERTDCSTLLKSQTRLTQPILYISSVCLAASLRFCLFFVLVRFHTHVQYVLWIFVLDVGSKGNLLLQIFLYLYFEFYFLMVISTIKWHHLYKTVIHVH